MASPRSVRLANVYILREAHTPRACAVCRRPTTYVLSSESAPMLDNMYLCLSHTTDRTVVTPLASADRSGCSASAVRPSAEEVNQVIREWHAKHSSDTKSGLPAAPAPHSEALPPRTPPTASPSGVPLAPTVPQSGAPLHTRFALHREFFAQRVRQLTPRRVPAFPSVPGGRLPAT